MKHGCMFEYILRKLSRDERMIKKLIVNNMFLTFITASASTVVILNALELKILKNKIKELQEQLENKED